MLLPKVVHWLEPPLERHVPLIEKHPVAMLMPLPNVEVAVAEMLMVFAPMSPSENSVPGVDVPTPRFPVVLSKRNPETPALPNRTVEDAFSPPKSESAVDVAFVFTPKFKVGVNENVPLPEPQAVPVFEMRPVTENWAQPVEPPAEETRRSVVEAVAAVIIVVDAYGMVCNAANVFAVYVFGMVVEEWAK